MSRVFVKKKKLPITVLIAIKNEAVNLPRCLSSLGLADRVVIVDSQSTDDSVRIAMEHGAEVVQFKYMGRYPKKRQWALENININTPWVFLMDADELISLDLWTEIEHVISQSSSPDAFFVKKEFHFLGQKIRYGGFSFSAVLLFRKGKARFERLFEDALSGLDMEVHERIIVSGTVGALKNSLIHEDFKGLDAYITRHNQYASWEASLRYSLEESGCYGYDTISAKFWGNSQERRRFLKRLIIRLPLEHLVWFIWHYFCCLGFLEGRIGLIACQIRATYISQVKAKLYELKLKNKK
jgi:glycosyltransferase involved in cell wall biosynthesis